MHRNANKLVDFVANQGVRCKEGKIVIGWQAMRHDNLKTPYHNLAEEDKKVFQDKTKKERSQ